MVKTTKEQKKGKGLKKLKLKKVKSKKNSGYNPFTNISTRRYEDKTSFVGTGTRPPTEEQYEKNRNEFEKTAGRRDEARYRKDKRMEKYWQKEINKYKRVKK